MLASFPCSFPFPRKQHTLLGQKQSISLLNRNAMPRVLVIRRKPGRMRALADFAVDDFLQSVDALGGVRGVGDEHKMHAVRVLAKSFVTLRLARVALRRKSG
jgi:hypothetical protein